MLHDSAFAPHGSTHPSQDRISSCCRRSGDRLPYPCELILIWHHDPATRIRYRIVDASDGGFRIRTNLPVVEGMTGMALKLLPDGKPVNRPVMVVWVAEAAEDDQDSPIGHRSGGHEAGLRFF